MIAVIISATARMTKPEKGIVGVSVSVMVIVKFCVTPVPSPLLAVTVPE